MVPQDSIDRIKYTGADPGRSFSPAEYSSRSSYQDVGRATPDALIDPIEHHV